MSKKPDNTGEQVGTRASASGGGGGPAQDIPPFRYTAALADQIERRWQAHWDQHATFRTPNPGGPGFDAAKPKFYCLDMFPYPSGAGLHVGHPEGYTATDIVCRYQRMKGRRVLHPMGWDAFGLPAEQYAIQTGVHPALTTKAAIETFRRQLKRFGFSYDWSREIATMEPAYYRWTQWIFLKIYNAWYDHEADRARPIDELIAGLERGEHGVSVSDEPVPLAGPTAGIAPPLTGEPIGVRRWHELSQPERRRFIDAQRLAYVAEQTVNWCPRLGTALANEEVIDGKSERGGYPVLRKPLKQWMFRITAYAQRLLKDLDLVQWPESTRTQQTEWIGRSEGAEVDFDLAEPVAEYRSIRVYTTRPDTIFGATYMVLSPEHPLVDRIIHKRAHAPETKALKAYAHEARNKSDVERMAEAGAAKDKTGVFTGVYAVNPATGQRIPVWVADYVLMGYGTGAIMAVPGQDQRDWDFAERFDLPIVRTVRPADGFDGKAYLGDGPAMNSGFLDGLPIDDAKKRIIDWLEEKSLGKRAINYKLRDWLFSRQRYWGEPFPIVWDDKGDHHPVHESALPVLLPDLQDYKPIESSEPRPLLAKAVDWVSTIAAAAGVTTLPPDTPVRRETNTMPGWAGSCWYYLRFCDPTNTERFVSRQAERAWMLSCKKSADAPPPAHAPETHTPGIHHAGGVDLYIGGAEHAVLHLLYARFWHKVLFDLGEVSTPEPFGRLFHQGMITSYAYQRPDKSLVPTDQVVVSVEVADTLAVGIEEMAAVKKMEGNAIPPEVFVEKTTGQPVQQVVAKMSKSLKNVINPDDIIAEFGADTFRLYEMYMGPLEATKPWNTRDTIGLFRFLQRAWRLAVNEQTGAVRLAAAPDPAVERQLHKTIARLEHDIERLALNTAIAALIEFVNAATAASGLTRDQLERFALLLAPFAPHMAEEIWARLGHTGSLAYEPFPRFDPAQATDDTIEIPVQIMGKVRSKITVAAGADSKTIEAAALADEKVRALIEGKTVKKVIVIPGRMVNIVAG